MASRKQEVLEVAGRRVAVTNPGKVFFPRAGITKLDLVRYYLAVADGAVRGVRDRPMALKRFVDGAEGEFFFQKRAPASRPDWIDAVELRFPSGRSALEVVVRDAAQLAWVVNLGCLDLHPHPVRASDLDHPDELRVDLDPVPALSLDREKIFFALKHVVDNAYKFSRQGGTVAITLLRAVGTAHGRGGAPLPSVRQAANLRHGKGPAGRALRV